VRHLRERPSRSIAASERSIRRSLSFAKRILALFGGSITVENLEPSGIQLTVSLKAA
jgi:hypothetical protein